MSSSKEVVPPSIDQNLSLYNVEGLDPRLGPVSKPPPLPTETSLPPLSISLSSDTFHRSNPEVTLTLTVTVLLHSSAPNPITLDIRGQRWDLAQTVPMESLYLSHFTFTDTSPGVPLTPETPCASCDSGLDLNKEDALTLYPGKPHTLSHGFHNPDLVDIGLKYRTKRLRVDEASRHISLVKGGSMVSIGRSYKYNSPSSLPI